MSRGTDHLVRDLADLGIRLEADHDQLVVDAPGGVLTAELRATLTDHKAELLALLRHTDIPERVETWELGPDDCVPPDELTAVDRAANDAGRRVRPDGTLPPSMRPSKRSNGHRACGPANHHAHRGCPQMRRPR